MSDTIAQYDVLSFVWWASGLEVFDENVVNEEFRRFMAKSGLVVPNIDYCPIIEWMIERDRALDLSEDEARQVVVQYIKEFQQVKVRETKRLQTRSLAPDPMYAPEPRKSRLSWEALICIVGVLIFVIFLGQFVDRFLWQRAHISVINFVGAFFHIPSGKAELVTFQDGQYQFWTRQNCQPAWKALDEDGNLLGPPPSWPDQERSSFLKERRVACVDRYTPTMAMDWAGYYDDKWIAVSIYDNGTFAYRDPNRATITSTLVWLDGSYFWPTPGLPLHEPIYDISKFIGKPGMSIYKSGVGDTAAATTPTAPPVPTDVPVPTDRPVPTQEPPPIPTDVPQPPPPPAPTDSPEPVAPPVQQPTDIPRPVITADRDMPALAKVIATRMAAAYQTAGTVEPQMPAVPAATP